MFPTKSRYVYLVGDVLVSTRQLNDLAAPFVGRHDCPEQCYSSIRRFMEPAGESGPTSILLIS